MKVKKVLFYLLVGILGGCGPALSLYPLYNVSDTIYEPKLIGIWTDDVNNVTLDFTRPEAEGRNYRLVYTSVDKDTKKVGKGLFSVFLVRLGNKLFLDAFPQEMPNGTLEDANNYKWLYNSFFLVPAHTFAVVDSIEPQLKIRLIDSDKLKDFLEKEPGAIKHEIVADSLVLSAKTAELQKFVIRNADNRDIFGMEMTLKRQK